MKKLFHLSPLVLIALGTAPPSLIADLIVDSWSIGAGISDLAGQEGVHFSAVVNPLQDSHSVSYRNSNISASYDFGWLLDEAHFDITTSHHLAQLDGQTSTSGRIFLTPSVDSLVTFSGNWQYAWPSAALGQTGFVMAVFDLATEEPMAIEFEFGGNIGIGPPFGTVNLAGSAVIPAGGQYMLHYSASVDHIDPTPPGTFGEASGEFHFTITPIPEPAAAMLLLLPFLAMRSRRLR